MSIQSAWNFVMRCCSNADQNNAETSHAETNNVLLSLDATTPIFSLDGMNFQAKIVDVHDGDTVKVVFKVFDKYYKWNCRIAHVDTPELRTDDPAEKARGLFVRDKLREQILNKIVTLHCLKFDKYGRLLVEINNGQNIHEWLIQNKYANPYEGKTKIKYVK
jgi:endonuclease YncB( thermonuclease family)